MITFVSIVDCGNEPKSAFATVLISLIDVNDNAPVFDSLSYTFDIEEATPAFTMVGAVSATDADSLDTNIYYSLTSQSTEFSIDPDTGVIVSLMRLDREDNSRYKGSMWESPKDTVFCADEMCSSSII